jgi:hypothetical protein
MLRHASGHNSSHMWIAGTAVSPDDGERRMGSRFGCCPYFVLADTDGPRNQQAREKDAVDSVCCSQRYGGGGMVTDGNDKFWVRTPTHLARKGAVRNSALRRISLRRLPLSDLTVTSCRRRCL